jgi:signal transduction histidine kinase
MSPAALTSEDLLTLNRQAIVARLVSVLAHDVNNALQVISGSVELLRQTQGTLSDPVHQALSRISGQVAGAATAVSSVTAFAQAPAEAAGSVPLGAVAVRAVALHRNALNRADVAVVLDVEADEVRALAPPSQLLLVALNLVSNAERALRRTSERRLTLSVKAEGSDAVLRVADNGPGVPVEERARIFEPFVSSGPRTERQGLGLPVSAAIAQAHGGTLVLEPSPAGATFALRLPRVVD